MAVITWSPQAIRDLEDICSYRSRTAPSYATGFAGKVVAIVETLADAPFSGSEVDEYGDPRIREKVCGKHRIIYRTGIDTVEVLTIIHGARRLPKFLDRKEDPS